MSRITIICLRPLSALLSLVRAHLSVFVLRALGDLDILLDLASRGRRPLSSIRRSCSPPPAVEPRQIHAFGCLPHNSLINLGSLWLRTSQAWLAIFCIIFARNAYAARVSTLSDSTHADKVHVKVWDVDDGLSQYVYAMAQTPDGYLWFGTLNGLVRFDGVKSVVFNRTNVPQLPSEIIENLHVDATHRLWVTTGKGIASLKDNHWTVYGPAQGWTENAVCTFAEGAGKMFVTTFNGKVFQIKDQRFHELPKPPDQRGRSGRQRPPSFGHLDDMGRLWLVNYGFFGFWDDERWHEARAPDWLDPDYVCAGPARDGGLWVYDGGRLRKFRRGKVVQEFKISTPGGVWNLSEDSQGFVWLNTYDNGLLQVSPGKNRHHFTRLNGSPVSGIRFVFEDREGNKWVGTGGDGLLQLEQRAVFALGVEHGLASPRTTSLSFAGTGEVWVGTLGGGLARIVGNRVTTPAFAGNHLRPHYINCVLSDRTGRLWIGTIRVGISNKRLYLKERNEFRAIEMEPSAGPSINALFEDSRGRIWIAGSQDVVVFENEKFTPCRPGDGLRLNTVTAFAEDPTTGAIWLGTQEHGVYRYEQSRLGKVVSLGDALTGPILALSTDVDGTLWIGTNALARLRHGRVSVFDETRGLPVGRVWAIVDDQEGNLWLGTERGIIQVSRAALNAVAEGRQTQVGVQRFDQHDGLPSSDFAIVHQPAAARDASGRLWFATSKGIAIIDPKRVRRDPNPPAVLIESLQFATQDGRSRQLLGPLGLTMTSTVEAASSPGLDEPLVQPLLLPRESRHLEIQYSAPTFTAPQRTVFQVKLEPGDPDWLDVGNRRVAYFYELRPGNYTFRVRAATENRAWSERDTKLAFGVLPYFWETLWFKTLCFALLAVLAYGVLHWRLMRQKKEYAAQQAFTREIILSQEKERKRVASELHDGLCQDLVLIKGRLALAATRQSDAAEHARQLDAAAEATTRAIEEVRAISHAMWPTALEQLGLTKAIESMVAQLGEGSATNYVAELDNIDGLLAPEMEMNLFRIIQEGLKNIIRHAGASQVILELKRADSGLRMSLFDNGKGFDVDGTRGGLGLASINERVRYLAGSLALQSAPGRGTRMTVGVPFTHTKGLKA